MYKFYHEDINVSTVRLCKETDFMFKIMKENYCSDPRKAFVDRMKDGLKSSNVKEETEECEVAPMNAKYNPKEGPADFEIESSVSTNEESQASFGCIDVFSEFGDDEMKMTEFNQTMEALEACKPKLED